MAQKKDFFVSYRSADEPWASWIAWQLEEAGYTTFFQAWDFRPGQNFVHHMEEGMKRSERTIAVITQAYLESDYTRAEWYATFKRDPIGQAGTLLPIRVQSCDPGALLGPIVYIDLVSLDEAEARLRLLEGVEKARVKPLKAPPYPLTKPQFPGPNPSYEGLQDSAQPRPIYDLDKLKHSLSEAYRFGRLIQDEFQSLGSGHISNLTKPALEEVRASFKTHLVALREYFSLYTSCYSVRIEPHIYKDLDSHVAHVDNCLDVIHSYITQIGSSSDIRIFEHFEEVKSSLRTFYQAHVDIVNTMGPLLPTIETMQDSPVLPHDAGFPPHLYGKVKHLQKICDQLVIKADAYVKQVVSVIFLVLEEHNA